MPAMLCVALIIVGVDEPDRAEAAGEETARLRFADVRAAAAHLSW